MSFYYYKLQNLNYASQNNDKDNVTKSNISSSDNISLMINYIPQKFCIYLYL